MSKEFTVDTIKSCFKLFGDIEGFEYSISGIGNVLLKLPTGNTAVLDKEAHYLKLDIWLKTEHPLFLQRVIEAIIKKYGFEFDLYFDKEARTWSMIFYNKNNIQYPKSKGLLKNKENVVTGCNTSDEAKQSAILYIIDQLEGKGCID